MAWLIRLWLIGHGEAPRDHILDGYLDESKPFMASQDLLFCCQLD